MGSPVFSSSFFFSFVGATRFYESANVAHGGSGRRALVAALEIEHGLLLSLSLSQTYTPGLAVFGTACGQPDVSLSLVKRAFIEHL